MEYPNDNTKSRRNKHLNLEERVMIEIRLKDGFSPYKVAKELKRPINTVLNEIRRGTTTQIKQGGYFCNTRYENLPFHNYNIAAGLALIILLN